MFTGLIEEVGAVTALDRRESGGNLSIDCEIVVGDAKLGDSIAVNGCCLTVTELTPGGGFSAEMMGETLLRTTLGGLVVGGRVNLERAMLPDVRLGGHMVQGHVDGVGAIRSIEPFPEWTTVTYDLPPELARYVVEKGSITIDGTSLTVTGAGPDWFSVGLIPHTMAVTIHGDRAVGDRVNLEVDVIGKYVERQLEAHLTALTERFAQGPSGSGAVQPDSARTPHA